MYEQQPFERSVENPILTPGSLPFRALGVLNPGATEQDGDVVLLVRVDPPMASLTCMSRGARTG